MPTVEQIQEQVQHLSEPLQQEMLDFVEHLRLKQAKRRDVRRNKAQRGRKR